MLVSQQVPEAILWACRPHVTQAEGEGNRRQHEGRSEDRSERDKGGTVGEGSGGVARRGDRKAGLADPTGAGQGEERDGSVGEEGADGRQLAFAPDEGRTREG